MKKKGLLLVLTLITCFALCACGGSGNPEAEAALNGNTYYLNAGTDNSLYVISFEEGEAILTEKVVDGNGIHDSLTDSGSLSIDEENITIKWGEIEEMVIPFTLDESDITLPKQFKTKADVKSEIQGIWKCRYTDNILGKDITSEYNLKFTKEKAKYQNATSSSVDGYDYFYSGPFDCEYEISDGVITLSGEENEEIYFNVSSKGKIEIYHFTHKYKKAETFPDVNSYSF